VYANAEMRVVSRGDRANQAVSSSFNRQDNTRYRQLLDPNSLDIVENTKTYLREMIVMYRRWNMVLPENLQIQADELGVPWQ
jgi:hypothetical protein